MVLQKTTSPTAGPAANATVGTGGGGGGVGTPTATLHNHRHPTAYLSHLYYNAAASPNRQPWSLNYRPSGMTTDPSNESQQATMFAGAAAAAAADHHHTGGAIAGEHGHFHRVASGAPAAATGAPNSVFTFRAPCANDGSTATATSATVPQSGVGGVGGANGASLEHIWLTTATHQHYISPPTHTHTHTASERRRQKTSS